MNNEYYVITQYDPVEGHSEPLYIYDNRPQGWAKLSELVEKFPHTDFQMTGLALGEGNRLSVYVD